MYNIVYISLLYVISMNYFNDNINSINTLLWSMWFFINDYLNEKYTNWLWDISIISMAWKNDPEFVIIHKKILIHTVKIYINDVQMYECILNKASEYENSRNNKDFLKSDMIREDMKNMGLNISNIWSDITIRHNKPWYWYNWDEVYWKEEHMLLLKIKEQIQRENKLV